MGPRAISRDIFQLKGRTLWREIHLDLWALASPAYTVFRARRVTKDEGAHQF